MTVLSGPVLSAPPFIASAISWFREQADIADGDTMSAKANARALRQLADYLESLDPSEDQHIAAMAEAQSAVGKRDTFVPGPLVRRVTAAVGRDLKPPLPPDLLDEIVRCSAEDSRTGLRAQAAQDCAEATQRAEERVRATYEDESKRAREAESEAIAKATEAEAELTEARKRIEHLESRLEAEAELTGAQRA